MNQHRGFVASVSSGPTTRPFGERIRACGMPGFIFHEAQDRIVAAGWCMPRKRKFIVYVATSADGFIARKDGSVDCLVLYESSNPVVPPHGILHIRMAHLRHDIDIPFEELAGQRIDSGQIDKHH